MLTSSLFYALFAYALAFALALMVAGMIKVIQLATRTREDRASKAAAVVELTKTEVKQST